MKNLSGLIVRIADVTIALFASILAAPLILLAGVLIRLESPGPALFRQKRVGKGERLFVCLKLRTMDQGTPSLGTHEVSGSAVTRSGVWLRRVKLDELPQLWNVLVGEMSLVGPRPCLPNQTDLIAARRARGVFNVAPGVTGSAQLKGIDMSTPTELAVEDAAWAAHPNLPDYVKFIALTVLGGGRGDRVRVD